MRDLVFKNIISPDRRKKVISSCEITNRNGMCTAIRRHFVCKIIDIYDTPKEKPKPYVYVSRLSNHAQQREAFFCRMKGSLYAVSQGRLFLILFGHSLKIDLRPAATVYPLTNNKI